MKNKHREKVNCYRQNLKFLIFHYSEECAIIENLQAERQQLVCGSRGDVCIPLKQLVVVTKPNTRRHF